MVELNHFEFLYCIKSENEIKDYINKYIQHIVYKIFFLFWVSVAFSEWKEFTDKSCFPSISSIPKEIFYEI